MKNKAYYFLFVLYLLMFGFILYICKENLKDNGR